MPKFDIYVSHNYVEGVVHRKVHMPGFQLYHSIVTGATCGTRNANFFSGTPDFIHFGQFMISPCQLIHTLPNWSVFGLCLRIIGFVSTEGRGGEGRGGEGRGGEGRGEERREHNDGSV